MTTKAEFVAILKAENPTLRGGSEEKGYTNFTPAEYDAQIGLWADNRVAKEVKDLAEQQEAATYAKDRADGLAKLEALGLTIGQAKAVARKDK